MDENLSSFIDCAGMVSVKLSPATTFGAPSNVLGYPRGLRAALLKEFE